MCVPALASAQGYYGGPGGGYQSGTQLPGGFHNRVGRMTFGGSFGLGGMHDSGSGISSCGNCDVEPLAVEADFHIGGVIGPRFALMFEGQVNAQSIGVNSPFAEDDTVLVQGAAMVAGQYWVMPQLWVKGGIGLASLQVDDAYFVEDFGTGGAVMGAIGVELMSARNFALELQGRVIGATYNTLDDTVTSGTIGLGINWY